jgi:quinol monooxygenase YgiN
MYGLIGKMIAIPGQRDTLISIMLDGSSKMPGCLSYVIAKDPTDMDALWITEVWENQESHQESLHLASVRQAITLGRPLIANFDEHYETVPVGGLGINSTMQ